MIDSCGTVHVVMDVYGCLPSGQDHACYISIAKLSGHWLLPLGTPVQSTCHRLWFSTKTCSCYSTKTHINKRDTNPQIQFDFVEKHIQYTLKCVWCSTKTTFNVYVSQRSQIQFEDENHAVYKSFR